MWDSCLLYPSTSTNKTLVHASEQDCITRRVNLQFNSVGNSSGLFGPWLLGEVVGRTCSYNLAFYIMGGFLAAAGVLVHLSEDKAGSKAAAVHTSKSYVELPQQPYIARMGGNREDATLDSATSDPMPALDEV